MKACSVEDCARPARARRLCATHYSRWQKTGTTADPVRPHVVEELPPHVSYRQFDYWCRTGLLQVAHKGGTGNYRDMGASERRVLTAMAELVHAGLPPVLAVRLARELQASGVAMLNGFSLRREGGE